MFVNLTRANCVGVSGDGTASMTDEMNGFDSDRIQQQLVFF